MLADSIVVVDLLVTQQPTLTIIPNQDTSMVEFLIYITILKTFNIKKKFETTPNVTINLSETAVVAIIIVKDLTMKWNIVSRIK